MTKFKLSILALVIIGLVFISCNKEEDNIYQSETQQLVSKQINSYLNEKVSNYEISDVNNNDDEYFFANIKTASTEGYLITNKKQNRILVFINFDLINSTTIIYDYVKDNEVFSENIDMLLSNDFNKFVNDVSDNNISSRRFWGWSCGKTGTTTIGDCVRTCCYYILGVRNSCDVYNCDNLPGKNPVIIN